MSTAKVQRQEINLYTLDFRRGDQAFSFNTIVKCCLMAFTLLMLVEAYGAWNFWSNQQHLIQLNVAQQAVAEQLARLKQSQPLSQRPKLEQQVSELQRQVQQRRELQLIMGGQKLGNFDGFSAFLASLARQANTDLSLTEIHLLEGGNYLELQGWTRAPEAVPRYLQNLRQEPSFESVRFGVLNIEKDPQYTHKLHFRLDKAEDDPT